MVMLLTSIMAMSIGENIRASFKFAKDGLVGKWTRWLLLLVFSIIPPFCFITFGYFVHIFRGGDEAPELDDWWGLFVDGVLISFVGILYMLIPLALLVASVAVGLYDGVLLGAVLAMLSLVLLFFCGLIGIAGCIRFARTGSVKEAFHIPAVMQTIGEVGWGRYLLSYLIFLFICFIIDLVLVIFPVVGMVLFIIVTPPLLLWLGKFYANLYSAV
jgi:hypothetical protein